MPTLYLPLLERLMAGEGPPQVPRRVVRRARLFGHLITSARCQATIAVLCGTLYQLEDERFAVFVNGRWVITFDWEDGLTQAHSLELERV